MKTEKKQIKHSRRLERVVGPLGDAEVETFLKEYNEGKHPLPPEYAAALEASRDDLMRRVREILRQRPC